MYIALDFPRRLCYTHFRCKAHKNKVLTGLPAIPAVK